MIIWNIKKGIVNFLTLQQKRKKRSLTKGAVTRGNFFLQLATQIWVKKILQAPVEL